MLCLMRQGTSELSTCGGTDASLLAQDMGGRLALVESLRMVARFRLSVIPSADESLCNLGQFAFFALLLFSAARRHSSDVLELLRLVEILEELHTELQGMISYPHMDTTLLYDVLQRWSQLLNRCVAELALELVEAPGASAPSISNKSWLIWRGDTTWY